MSSTVKKNLGAETHLGTPAARLRSVMELLILKVPHLSCAMLRSLLTVAVYPNRNLGELAKLAAVPQSTMSRHMLDLSTYSRSRIGMVKGEIIRNSGYGLVEVTNAPDSMRAKNYNLSDKGKRLIGLVGDLLA
jgi:DNA-binding MarR family transcriptional regulator